jgi:hypothetical protein
LAGVVAATGVLVGGCGSGDEDAGGGASTVRSGSPPGAESEKSASSEGSPERGPGAKRITKAAFIKKADGICDATVDRISVETASALQGADSSGADRVAVETRLVSSFLVPALRGEVEQIQALGSPPGDEEEIDSILAAIENLIERAEARPATIAANPDSFAKANEVAERYGVGFCPYG